MLIFVLSALVAWAETPAPSQPVTATMAASKTGPPISPCLYDMLGTGLIMVVILLSPPLARKFGKKAVSAASFALATVDTLAFYLLSSANVNKNTTIQMADELAVRRKKRALIAT